MHFPKKVPKSIEKPDQSSVGIRKQRYVGYEHRNCSGNRSVSGISVRVGLELPPVGNTKPGPPKSVIKPCPDVSSHHPTPTSL
jgi:hypothetical protein